MLPPVTPPSGVASVPQPWRRVLSPPVKYDVPLGRGSLLLGIDGKPLLAYSVPRLVGPRSSAENDAAADSDIVRTLAVSSYAALASSDASDRSTCAPVSR